MKKIYPFIAFLATPLIILLMSNSSGSPGGKTGSPGDGNNTCTQCHNGTANTVSNWITTNIPASGYVEGQTYSITATGTHAGVNLFGFELTVENNQGTKVGTLQISDPTRTKLINSNKAVTHTSNGTTPNGNSNSWSMNWIAPTGIQGDIGIYAAFNAANGNGSTSGDVIYKSSTFVSSAPPPQLVSIVPGEAEQGQTILITITGANTQFSGLPSVSFKFSGNPDEIMNANNVNVNSPTVLQAELSVPSEASPGLWDLHVDDLMIEDGFTVLAPTGVNDNSLSIVRIYPNPANSYFFIENAMNAEISVLNTKGERMLNLMINSEKQFVNISNLSRGVYLVRIQGQETARVHKLVIN